MSWFKKIFDRQRYLQEQFNEIPNVVQTYNSATAAMVEIGEMLQEDTRWKAFTTGSKKPPHTDREAFIEELSDAIIYLINTGIYAGFSAEDLQKSIDAKIEKNYERFGLKRYEL